MRKLYGDSPPTAEEYKRWAKEPEKPPASDSSDSLRFNQAAIATYMDMAYQDEKEIFIRDATILLAEIMRDEVNAQDECERFLRDRAPKMLAEHYQNTREQELAKPPASNCSE